MTFFRAYDQLDIKHEPLTLIPPNFDTPLPPLQPAVRCSENLFGQNDCLAYNFCR